MQAQTRQALDSFFREYEQQAYKMTLALIHNQQDALEIVQDSMLKLVQKYKNRQPQEWPPLFFRILQNSVKDWYRRQKYRNLFDSLLAGLQLQQQDQFESRQHEASPERQLLQCEEVERIHAALRLLPLRQQQTFLMRAMQEFSTRETAFALSISENSVKTHYARATSHLRVLLGDSNE